MNVLCLGAGGFIGSHLTHRLLDEGHRVVGVDTQSDKLRECLGDPRLVFLQEDITDPGCRIEDLVRDSDVVFDLIAYANPAVYVRQPVHVFRLNFTENLRIAEYCMRHHRRLIQFSSCEVYGKTPAAGLRGSLSDPDNPAHATFSEDTSDCILGPVAKHRWIYASAKQLLERVLHAYGLEGRLDYTVVRPFNFIGPRIDYLPAADGDGTPRVFSCFMAALLRGAPLKLVDGGAHRRCYTYIDDAVECVYRILVNPGGVCDRQIFNIGAPANEVSIRRLAELMREIYARRFRKGDAPLSEITTVSAEEFYGAGYEDSDRRIPDIGKARRLLGWEPRWMLPELLDRTMACHVSEQEAAS